jgi:hypothetical protein
VHRKTALYDKLAGCQQQAVDLPAQDDSAVTRIGMQVRINMTVIVFRYIADTPPHLAINYPHRMMALYDELAGKWVTIAACAEPR